MGRKRGCSDAVVLEIRQLAAAGYRVREIARVVGVGKSTVQRVLSGEGGYALVPKE